MSDLQERILEESEKLLKKSNWLFNLINVILLSGLIILIVFLAFIDFIQLNAITISLIVTLSAAYVIFRRLYGIQYNIRVMEQLHQKAIKDHPELTIYIPILRITFQGIFIRSAGIYILNDELYLEAYNRPASKKTERESIIIKGGKDFFITEEKVHKKYKLAMFFGQLMNTKYQFGIADIKEISDMINKYIKKEV